MSASPCAKCNLEVIALCNRIFPNCKPPCAIHNKKKINKMIKQIDELLNLNSHDNNKMILTQNLIFVASFESLKLQLKSLLNIE